MFSWICPQCGRDVPPSKTDCPYCAERAAEAQAAGLAAPPVPAAAAPPQPPPPQYAAPQYQQPAQAPQQYYQPPPQGQHPQYAGPHQHAAAWAPPKAGPPTWLMTIGVALILLMVGGGVWYYMQRGSNPAEKAGLENPTVASRQKVSNPLQKYVEVVGLRLFNENKRPVARFVVVNHSSAEITDLAANVTLWASTSRSEEDSVGSFSFKVPSLGPNASKDMTEPLKTKLKMYELPDWQNTTAEIEITSPAAQ
jgi:hypothetical protein